MGRECACGPFAMDQESFLFSIDNVLFDFGDIVTGFKLI